MKRTFCDKCGGEITESPLGSPRTSCTPVGSSGFLLEVQLGYRVTSSAGAPVQTDRDICDFCIIDAVAAADTRAKPAPHYDPRVLLAANTLRASGDTGAGVEQALKILDGAP